MTLTMHAARKRLATVWLAGFVAISLVLLFIIFFGQPVKPVDLWDWFLPAIVPTLSLIVGVLVYAHRHRPSHEPPVDAYLFRLAFGLSVFYVLMLLAPLLLFPLTGKALPVLLDDSRLWFAALQSIATGVLGAFFVRQDDKT